jgi:acyl-coenzyme A thioesterase PaaI-like protein
MSDRAGARTVSRDEDAGAQPAADIERAADVRAVRQLSPEQAPPETATPAGVVVRPALLRYEDFRIRPHNCFACGQLNEIGLHLKLNLEAGRCWTELEMPRRFEGWEGIIHGGILCTILDEVMAWALVAEDSWGVTARMSIEFRKAVTVGQAIRAEGWITESRRRVHGTAGRILDGTTGVELAAAQATYVAATDAKKRELKERYGLGGGGETS